jgi:hypothetical protein
MFGFIAMNVFPRKVFLISTFLPALLYLTGFWWGNLRKRSHCGDPDVDGRIILRWIFRKWRSLWGLDRVGSG